MAIGDISRSYSRIQTVWIFGIKYPCSNLFTFLNETGCLIFFTFSDRGVDQRNVKTSHVGHTLLTLRLYNLVSTPNGNFV